MGKRPLNDMLKDKKDLEIETPVPRIWQEELYISKMNQLAL